MAIAVAALVLSAGIRGVTTGRTAPCSHAKQCGNARNIQQPQATDTPDLTYVPAQSALLPDCYPTGSVSAAEIDLHLEPPSEFSRHNRPPPPL